MKSFTEFVIPDNKKISESLQSQDQIKLFQAVIKANDVELSFKPSYNSKDSVIKILAKSVDRHKIFNIYISDIEVTVPNQSINVDF